MFGQVHLDGGVEVAAGLRAFQAGHAQFFQAEDFPAVGIFGDGQAHRAGKRGHADLSAQNCGIEIHGHPSVQVAAFAGENRVWEDDNAQEQVCSASLTAPGSLDFGIGIQNAGTGATTIVNNGAIGSATDRVSVEGIFGSITGISATMVAPRASVWGSTITISSPP